MGTTQPIREKEELKQFMDYYRNTRPNARNYVLIPLGCTLRFGSATF